MVIVKIDFIRGYRKGCVIIGKLVMLLIVVNMREWRCYYGIIVVDKVIWGECGR